jgi:NhaC family Na+:H+ antiporter
MLGFNVYVYGDEALSGSNQFVLLLGAVAALVGFFNKVSFDRMIEEVAENIKATVGSNLAYGWCISRYLVSKRNYSIMIYYGLQILSPVLPATELFLTVPCYSWYRFDELVAHWGLIWEWLQ